MRRWKGMVVAFVVALTGALPVSAADAPALPTLAPLRSMRQNFVAASNGTPLFVCQEEWASFNRGHIVCRELVTITVPEFAGLSLRAGDLYEYVLYDDDLYIRRNDETTWTRTLNPSFDSAATLNDLFDPGFAATLTEVGPADVDGTPTTQYQFWATNEAFNRSKGGQAVYDLFIDAEPHVRKSQLSYRGLLSLGEGELAIVNAFRDFNANVDVGPPPSRAVRPSAVAPHAIYSRTIMPMLWALVQR
jgi:hypothetical protein